jgi:hypothetical protein
MNGAPDWGPALSVIAQSAAAFVAIIGGFLLSRLIQLAIDRGQLRRQRGNLRVDALRIENSLKETRRRLLLFHTGAFLFIVFSRLADANREAINLASLAESYRRANPMLAYEVGNEFDVLVQRLSHVIPQAFLELKREKEAGTLPLTLEEYRSASGVKRDLLEDYVYAFAFQAAHDYGNLFGYGSEHIQDYLLTGSPRDPAVRSTSEYQVVAEDWRRLLEQRKLSKFQIERVVDELKQSTRPAGFGSAIFVLAYLAVGGIVVPVLYLGHQPMINLSDTVITIRWQISHWVIVLVLFLSGLMLLFIYTIYLWRRLAGEAAGECDREMREADYVVPMALPDRPDHYPNTGGCERNMMYSYLAEKGIEVQILPGATGQRLVAFSYKGRDHKFVGADDAEVIKNAYVAVCDIEQAAVSAADWSTSTSQHEKGGADCAG